MTERPSEPVDQGLAGCAVAVVDEDPKLRTRLALQLGPEARATGFSSLGAMHEKLAPRSPLVLVLGPSFAGAGLAEVTHLIRARPEALSVLVVAEPTGPVVEAAARAGVGEVVALAEDGRPLAEAVERAVVRLRAAAPPPATAVAGRPAPGRHARVTAVLSPKGGVGRTFVATNLAVLLATREAQPVALVDADLRFGDVAVMLNLAAKHTVVEAVEQIDSLDATLLAGLLIQHEPSGLRVLAAPVEPALAEAVTVAHLRRLILLLSSFCSHVVIDTSSSFDELVLGLVGDVDDIVLVAAMDLPSIKSTKIALRTLRGLHVPETKVKLVLNRADSLVRLDVSDVERTLLHEADCLIPSDITVPRSINEGIPIVISEPRSGVARSLGRLAALIPSPAVA